MTDLYKVRQLLSDSTPELTYEEASFLTAVQVYVKEFGLVPLKEAEDKVDIYVSKPNGFKVIVTFTLLSRDTPYIHNISFWRCVVPGGKERYFSNAFPLKSAALSYITDLLLEEECLIPDTSKGTTVFVHNLETDETTEVLISYKNVPTPYIKDEMNTEPTEEDFCCPYCHELENKCECFEAEHCPQCHEYWGHCGCDYSVDEEIP